MYYHEFIISLYVKVILKKMKYFIFTIVAIYFFNKLNGQSISKYEMVIDRLVMPKNIVMDSSNLRVTNYNRTVKVLNGTLVLLKPLSDDMSATISIFLESGNEFRRIGMKEIEKICSLYKDEKNYLPKYIPKYTTIPYPIVCPIPAVKYIKF